MVSRRLFLLGSAALIAAPAVVKAENLMRIQPRRWLSADEVAARIVAKMGAWDNSPEGRADLIWRANPGLVWTRSDTYGMMRPPVPKEFIQIVQDRMRNA